MHTDRPENYWPALTFHSDRPTLETLHLWLQIVGKVRLVQSPWMNHSWHATFYVTARGLTTSAIPKNGRTFQIDFDFIDHRVLILTSEGSIRAMALRPRTVADFYAEFFVHMRELELSVVINEMPSELPQATAFSSDEIHEAYDPAAAHRFWRALLQADRVLKRFRSGFSGKASPVHFFWGAMDLATTRFSGRTAPRHPGGVPNLPDWVVREAYSHELMSVGFWPGSDEIPFAAFYAYAYPEPVGFKSVAPGVEKAVYHPGLGEFILPYTTVREAADPEAMLLAFCRAAYNAAADLGRWDRAMLEASPPRSVA